MKTYENQTRLRLTDLIVHRGKPPGTGTSPSESRSEKSQKVVLKVAQETDLLRQENQILRERIAMLEADQAEREALIRGQVALPAPERWGWGERLVGWVKNTKQVGGGENCHGEVYRVQMTSGTRFGWAASVHWVAVLAGGIVRCGLGGGGESVQRET